MTQLTLDLPDSLVDHARFLGEATHRDASTVLADTLEMMWPAWEETLNIERIPPVSHLSDDEVAELADLKMNPMQNNRLGELQAQGKASGLTPAEQFELLTLIHLYQIGQIRKSEGLAEAVRRGLKKPLPS
jgi:hypothetical protein